jgi:hypothetical protein
VLLGQPCTSIMSPAVHARRMLTLDRSSRLRVGQLAHEGSPARYGPAGGRASDDSPRSGGGSIRYSPRGPLGTRDVTSVARHVQRHRQGRGWPRSRAAGRRRSAGRTCRGPTRPGPAQHVHGRLEAGVGPLGHGGQGPGPRPTRRHRTCWARPTTSPRPPEEPQEPRQGQERGRGQGQRGASCECGWASRIGNTEQVMPEIRTHLDAALAGPLLWGPESTSPAVPTPRPGCIKGALCTSGTAGGGP